LAERAVVRAPADADRSPRPGFTGLADQVSLLAGSVEVVTAPSAVGYLVCKPAPQREALRTAFGLAPGSPPDRFLVGLAVLSLFSEMAEDRPLVRVVDDEQWLDWASVQALGFVGAAGRRPGRQIAAWL
jgi:hypothetical protein